MKTLKSIIICSCIATLFGSCSKEQVKNSDVKLSAIEVSKSELNANESSTLTASAEGENLVYRWFDASGNIISTEPTLKVTNSESYNSATGLNSNEVKFYAMVINTKAIKGNADLENIVNSASSSKSCCKSNTESCQSGCCAKDCKCCTGGECTCKANGIECGCNNGTCKTAGCEKKGTSGDCCKAKAQTCPKDCCVKDCKCCTGGECTCEANGVKCGCKNGTCKTAGCDKSKTANCCSTKDEACAKGCCVKDCKCSDGGECSCEANGVKCGCKNGTCKSSGCENKKGASGCKSNKSCSTSADVIKKLISNPSKGHAVRSVIIKMIN